MEFDSMCWTYHSNDQDTNMFQKAIPSVDYRSQVIHEAVVCCIGSVAIAIGVARIENVLLVLVPSFIAQLSK
jgi:hypothetical protein